MSNLEDIKKLLEVIETEFLELRIAITMGRRAEAQAATTIIIDACERIVELS